MTMHLVNLAKFSKSIFEFLFVPVITGFFLKTEERANAVHSGGAVKNPESNFSWYFSCNFVFHRY